MNGWKIYALVETVDEEYMVYPLPELPAVPRAGDQITIPLPIGSESQFDFIDIENVAWVYQSKAITLDCDCPDCYQDYLKKERLKALGWIEYDGIELGLNEDPPTTIKQCESPDVR